MAWCGPEPGPEPTLPTDAAEQLQSQKYGTGIFRGAKPAQLRYWLKQLDRDKCLVRPRFKLLENSNSEFLKKYDN